MRFATFIFGGLLLSKAMGQAVPEIHGELEGSYLATHIRGDAYNRGHAQRALLSYEDESFAAQAAYFFYPYCSGAFLDETFLKAKFSRGSFRVGKLYERFFQSNWYDMWDSGFIFLPEVTHAYYFGKSAAWYTAPGVEAEASWGKSKFTVGGAEDSSFADRPFPSTLSHATCRLETYAKDIVWGAGAYFEPKDLKSGNQIFTADARWAKDRWLVRGIVATSHGAQGGRSNGTSIDATYRVPNSDRLALLARIQTFDSLQLGDYGSQSQLKTVGYLVGFRYRLPFDFLISVNNNLGTTPLAMNANNGYSVQLQKTVRF